MEIGEWIAVSAFVVSAATLYTGRQRSTVDLLQKRVSALEGEVTDYHEKNTQMATQISQLLRENQWLKEQVQNMPREREPKRWFNRD